MVVEGVVVDGVVFFVGIRRISNSFNDGGVGVGPPFLIIMQLFDFVGFFAGIDFDAGFDFFAGSNVVGGLDVVFFWPL